MTSAVQFFIKRIGENLNTSEGQDSIDHFLKSEAWKRRVFDMEDCADIETFYKSMVGKKCSKYEADRLFEILKEICRVARANQEDSSSDTEVVARSDYAVLSPSTSMSGAMPQDKHFHDMVF